MGDVVGRFLEQHTDVAVVQRVENVPPAPLPHTWGSQTRLRVSGAFGSVGSALVPWSREGCLLWSFVYLVVRNLFALVWLLGRPRRSLELEILVLRHESAILSRQRSRPRPTRADDRAIDEPVRVTVTVAVLIVVSVRCVELRTHALTSARSG